MYFEFIALALMYAIIIFLAYRVYRIKLKLNRFISEMQMTNQTVQTELVHLAIKNNQLKIQSSTCLTGIEKINEVLRRGRLSERVEKLDSRLTERDAEISEVKKIMSGLESRIEPLAKAMQQHNQQPRQQKQRRSKVK